MEFSKFPKEDSVYTTPLHSSYLTTATSSGRITEEMLDVREMTIAHAQDGFKTKKFTAQELTSAFLDRIATLDKNGPRINSTMALSTTVLDEAAALDAYLEEKSQLKGKLHGIPVLVKDQVRINLLSVKIGLTNATLRPTQKG